MQYVVCYDVADDQRRSRLSSALLDFGQRVQESVFVANLEQELSARMLERVRRIADVNQDRVHVFRLCAACVKETVTLGMAAERVEDQEFYVI